ncbi:MAG TPA: transcriptional regulator [Peptococcaceae bacterium]|nr:transcriptional regulator [Peptococcaceae bacterium]
MLMDKDVEKLSSLFKALAEPTRIKIMYALSIKELCVCDLQAVLNISQSAVSHQLRLLKNLRLIKYRREGKRVYYSLDDDHIEKLFREGLEHISHH